MFTRNVEKIEKTYKEAKLIDENEKVEKWIQATKRSKMLFLNTYAKSESIYTNKNILLATGMFEVIKVPYASIISITTSKMYFVFDMIMEITYTDETGKTKKIAYATQKRDELIKYIEEKKKENS